MLVRDIGESHDFRGSYEWANLPKAQSSSALHAVSEPLPGESLLRHSAFPGLARQLGDELFEHGGHGPVDIPRRARP